MERKEFTSEKRNLGEKYNLKLQENDGKMYHTKRIKLSKRDFFASGLLQYQKV